MHRNEILSVLQDKPEVSVLIVGGGINGTGTFRDLAVNGVDILLVEKGDFLPKRSMLAMLVRVSGEMIDELTKALGNALGWDEERKATEVARTLLILADRHRIRL